MTGNSNISGEVLGASTAIGGFAALPYTGSSILSDILIYLAIGAGVLIFASFIVTRVIRALL